MSEGTANVCPRCRLPTLIKEKKAYGGIDVIKYTCSVCDSGFFFEEHITAYLIKVSAGTSTTIKKD